MSEILQKEKLNNRKSVEETTIQSKDKTTKDYLESLLSEAEYNKDASNQCKHPKHSHIKTAAFINLLPPEYWASYEEKTLSDNQEDIKTAEQANQAINSAFIKRLQELENRAPNALEAKLETYKEWVSVLQRLNNELLNDFDEFERTIENQLKAHESRSNFKYKRDVATLIKLIQQAFHYNNWSLADMRFETMTPAFVMGLDENKSHDMEILNKLKKGEYQSQKEQTGSQKKLSCTDMSVLALVVEVADKHDEIGRLKEQVCCLEDEIQNAHKKIQLKDDVIRELRSKNSNKFFNQDKSNTSVTSINSIIREMATVPTENVCESSSKSPRMSSNLIKRSTTCDSWTIAENLEYLKNQLQEILSASDWKIGSPKKEAERLRDIFMKLEADKNEAFERLKKIKENFLDILTTDQQDEQNIILNDNDEMLIEAVRDHIESISLARKELSHQVQELLIEKGEMAGKMEALNNINRINCDALKELADLLSSLTNEAFNYNEIYSNPTYNPFCQAICNLKSKLTKNIEDLTAQLSAEKEKHRRNELEIVELEKSNDGASGTKFSCIRNTRTPQNTNLQHLHLTTPTPRPRKNKNKPPDRKNDLK